MPRREGPAVLRLGGVPDAPLLDEALSALNRGGVAALPTDTVYGLAARADRRDAIKRIYSIKGRDFKKPLVMLVPDVLAAEKMAKDPTPLLGALAAEFWPGPLTLVLNASDAVRRWGLDSGGTIGIRCTPEPVVQGLLERLDVPLASTSANRSGDPECHSAREVLGSLDKKPDLVLDGGERPRRKASAVLDISGPRPVLLRKGAIGREELEKACGTEVKLGSARVLFVCTGNTCRSPMAEGYLRHALPKELRARVAVGSSGTGALAGMPATGTAQKAARKRGFDISRHRSRPLSRDLLEEADLVVAMEDRHRLATEELSPGTQASLLAPGGVPDPIGGDLDEYLETLDIIEREMPAVVERLRALLG